MVGDLRTSDDIRLYLASFYPTMVQMPFCSYLLDGELTKQQTLCAEVVELYRAFNTRDVIKSIYLGKVEAAGQDGELARHEVEIISGVVHDEGETLEHVDHLDMRLQLFSSVGLTRSTVLRPNATLDRINHEWVAVVAEASVFTAIALFAAIEDWYTGIAGLYADEYLRRGYSPYEIQTYSEHNRIEPTHSSLQMDVLAAHAESLQPVVVAPALTRVFRTSIGYDYMKLHWALSATLAELVETR